MEPEDEADLAAQRPRRRAFEAIVKAAKTGSASALASGSGSKSGSGSESAAGAATPSPDERELVIKFLRSPVEILPAPGGSDRVGAVRLSVNALRGPSGARKAVSTDARETISGATLVLRSVGYRAVPVPTEDSFKSYVPFDAERGVVPNRFGRVVEEVFNAGVWQVPGLYVCGWLKRGPTGIIGTNLNCAEETVGALIEDEQKGKLRRPDYRFKGKGGEGGETVDFLFSCHGGPSLVPYELKCS